MWLVFQGSGHRGSSRLAGCVLILFFMSSPHHACSFSIKSFSSTNSNSMTQRAVAPLQSHARIYSSRKSVSCQARWRIHRSALGNRSSGPRMSGLDFDSIRESLRLAIKLAAAGGTAAVVGGILANKGKSNGGSGGLVDVQALQRCADLRSSIHVLNLPSTSGPGLCSHRNGEISIRRMAQCSTRQM